MRTRSNIIKAAISVVLVAFTQSGVAQEQTLGQIQKVLISKKFVDLTHAFEPGIPHWGFRRFDAYVLGLAGRHEGYQVRLLAHVFP